MSEDVQEVVTVEVRQREESRKPHSEPMGPIGEVRLRVD